MMIGQSSKVSLMSEPITEPQWLSDEQQWAWRAYLEMQALLDLQIARDLADASDLSMADYRVLVDLSESRDHVLRVYELASRMRWSRSRLSHQLTRMETRGLVERRACPSDARGSLVELTPQGLRAIEDAAPSHVASVRRHVIDLVEPQELACFARFAETVAAHLRDGGESAG